jgi:hypothetical protein
LKPKKITAEPTKAIASVSPAAAMVALPISVIAAEIGSHSLRSSFSDQRTAATAQARKPKRRGASSPMNVLTIAGSHRCACR